jgi:RpiR family transcriptional regulator, carbohydrate utilization regulator
VTITTRKVLANVRAAHASLSPALARIAESVLENPDRLLTQTVTELAESAGSSDASVIRFCRDQGFASFQAFKLALATELARTALPDVGQSGHDAGIVERAVTALRETQDMLDPAAIAGVTKRLVAARRILLFGVGASAITVHYLQYKLARLGLSAIAHQDPHMAAMAAVALTANDVVIAVSSSGSTFDAVRAAERAHQAGAFLVAITNRIRSPLTAFADVVLLAASAETPLTGGAFASKISQFLIVDILFETIAGTHEPARMAIATTAESVSDRGY